MLPKTKTELGLALGCVVYDMLMLLVALSVFRQRRQDARYEGLCWGKSQISIEVILLKARLLMEFISPSASSHNDIVITDFGLAPVPLPHAIRSARKSINQWVAHLSWDRTRRSTKSSQPIQGEMEVQAVWILSKTYQAIESCLAGGVVFVEERHEAFYRVFQKLYVGMAVLPCRGQACGHS